MNPKWPDNGYSSCSTALDSNVWNVVYLTTFSTTMVIWGKETVINQLVDDNGNIVFSSGCCPVSYRSFTSPVSLNLFKSRRTGDFEPKIAWQPWVAAVAPLCIRPISNVCWRSLQHGIFKVAFPNLTRPKHRALQSYRLNWVDSISTPLAYCLNKVFVNWLCCLIGCLLNSQITNLPAAMYGFAKSAESIELYLFACESHYIWQRLYDVNK